MAMNYHLMQGKAYFFFYNEKIQFYNSSAKKNVEYVLLPLQYPIFYNSVFGVF